jgi:hypothetical protein
VGLAGRLGPVGGGGFSPGVRFLAAPLFLPPALEVSSFLRARALTPSSFPTHALARSFLLSRAHSRAQLFLFSRTHSRAHLFLPSRASSRVLGSGCAGGATLQGTRP